MHKIIFAGLLFFNITSFAQKQFNNGFMFAVGAEFLEDENYKAFASQAIFMDKPMYGARIGYERRLSNIFSLQANATYFVGFDSEEFTFVFADGPEPGLPEEGTIETVIQRITADVTAQFWVIENTNYAFTPGLALGYGRTLNYKHTIEEINSVTKYSTKSQYVNVSIVFTNRFFLTKLRNKEKGNYADLQLLVSPVVTANVFQKIEGFEWEYATGIFGGGLFVGLGLMF